MHITSFVEDSGLGTGDESCMRQPGVMSRITACRAICRSHAPRSRIAVGEVQNDLGDRAALVSAVHQTLFPLSILVVLHHSTFVRISFAPCLIRHRFYLGFRIGFI